MSQQNSALSAVADQINSDNGHEMNGNGVHAEIPLEYYATREAAQAAWKPVGKEKIFEIAHNGEGKGYLWAHSYDNALARAARMGGYAASLTSAPKISEAQLAAAVTSRLAMFSDEELAALGLSRKPAPKAVKGGK